MSSASSTSSNASLGSFAPLPEGANAGKSKDWWLIAGIIATAVAAYFTVFGLLCLRGMLPIEFLGGEKGASIVLAAGAVATICLALATFFRWRPPT